MKPKTHKGHKIMTKNDTKELPNFIDAYGCKIVTTIDIKEFTDILDRHHVKYKIVESNNPIHEGRTSSRDEDARGERIDRP